jgi:predicted permease
MLHRLLPGMRSQGLQMTDLIFKVLGIVAPILLTSGIGYFYARLKKPDMSSINTMTTDLIVPMLIFSGLASKDFAIADSVWLLLGGVMVMIGSGLLSLTVARWYGVSPRTLVPPMMFSNCAFLGLPLVVMALGPERLGSGVAIYVVMTIIQMTWGIKYLTGSAGFISLLKNPMVAASFLGLAVNLGHIAIPDWTASIVRMIGNAAVPLMLLSLGARLTQIDLKTWKLGILGAWLCPVSGLLVFLPVAHILPMSTVEQAQLLLFSALPPAVANYIIAERVGHEPGQVATIVLFGNLASIVVMPMAVAAAVGHFY